MHSRLAELFAYAERARADLRRAVDPLDLEARGRRPAEGRWSVHDTLEHLHLVESGVARLATSRIARGRAAGLGADPETSSMLGSLDAFDVAGSSHTLVSPEPVRPAADRGATDGGADAARIDPLPALDASRIALFDAYRSGDGLDLTRLTAKHAVLGELNLYQWLLFVAQHEQRHTRQVIATAAALAGRG